jgi:hypothetical protein
MKCHASRIWSATRAALASNQLVTTIACHLFDSTIFSGEVARSEATLLGSTVQLAREEQKEFDSTISSVGRFCERFWN